MGARVTVCDIDESRLEHARQLGVAEQVFNTSGDGWDAQIEADAYDAVMDFAGGSRHGNADDTCLQNCADECC